MEVKFDTDNNFKYSLYASRYWAREKLVVCEYVPREQLPEFVQERLWESKNFHEETFESLTFTSGGYGEYNEDRELINFQPSVSYTLVKGDRYG